MTTSDPYIPSAPRSCGSCPTCLRVTHTSPALVMTGLVRSQSGHLAKIARNLPLETQQARKEQRVRRLRQNPRRTALSAQHHAGPSPGWCANWCT